MPHNPSECYVSHKAVTFSKVSGSGSRVPVRDDVVMWLYSEGIRTTSAISA